MVGYLTGCDDLLDTEPVEEVEPEVALEDLEGVDAVVTSIYNRLQSEFRYGQQLILAPEILADNSYLHPDPSGRFSGEAVNATGAHINFWNTGYTLINESNTVVQSLNEMIDEEGDDDGFDLARAEMLIGEALFNRAYAYHDFARTYGYEPNHPMYDESGEQEGLSVPLRTEPTEDAEAADERPRATTQEIYDQIEQDLLDAIEFLEGNDRGDPYYVSYEAAHALLARVYLYAEQWDEAATHAENAINAAGAEFVDPEEYAGDFQGHPSDEALFELSIDPDTESPGVNEAIAPIILPYQWHDLMAADNLMELYDEDDVRLDLYDEEGGHTFTVKYSQSRGPHTDNTPLIRYPELYLIRAEALVEEGDVSGGVDYLNAVQEARGGYETSTSSYDEAIDEIMDERRREFAFEGHRFFDLKRRGGEGEGRYAEIPKAEGESPVPYDDFRVIAPIPETEEENNPEIQQNPEY